MEVSPVTSHLRTDLESLLRRARKHSALADCKCKYCAEIRKDIDAALDLPHTHDFSNGLCTCGAYVMEAASNG